MADVKIPLKVTWSGDQAKKGLRELKKEMTGVQKTVGNLSTFAKSTAGFLGITASVAGLVAVMRELGEEQRVMVRLERSVRNLGGSMDEVNRVLVQGRRNSFFGDTEIAAELNRMIVLTKDVEGSMKNMGLAMDLAEAHGKSLAETTRILASVMEGVVEPAGELSPAVREWAAANRDLAKTEEGVAAVLGMLSADTLGQSAAAMDTLGGSLHRFTTGLKELRDALAEGPLSTFKDAIGDIGLGFGEAAELIRQGKVLQGLIHGIPANALNRGELRRGSDRRAATQQMRQFGAPGANIYPAAPPGAYFEDMEMAAVRAELDRLDEQRFLESINNATDKLPDRFSDIRGEVELLNREFERTPEMAQEIRFELNEADLAFREFAQNAQNALTGAFNNAFQGILNGAKSFGDVLRSFFRDLIDSILKELAAKLGAKIVGFILSAATSGPGGAVAGAAAGAGSVGGVTLGGGTVGLGLSGALLDQAQMAAARRVF